MSRLIDDYEGENEDGPPTRDIKPPQEKPAAGLGRRHPDAKTDLDVIESVFTILDQPTLPVGRPIDP